MESKWFLERSIIDNLGKDKVVRGEVWTIFLAIVFLFCLSVCLSICLSVSQSWSDVDCGHWTIVFCLPVVCLYVCVPVCVPVCLPVRQSRSGLWTTFSCNPLSLLSAGVWLQAEESIIKRPLPSKRQFPAVQVEARSPDRNESGKEEKSNSTVTGMYLDNEVSITTPLTGGVDEQGGQRASNVDVEGELSEVDITSQHNSVISQTPDSTISGPVPVVICQPPGRALSVSTNKPDGTAIEAL